MKGLKLRTGSPADKSAIKRILTETPEFTPAEIEVAEEVLDCYLKDPIRSGYNILVADIGSSMVGYICYGPAPLTEATWDIYWIAVTPKEKRRGIGKALLTLAEERIKANSGKLILVETSSKANYENTRNFYRTQGYEIISRIPDFYASGDGKLTFHKRLDTEKSSLVS